MKQETGSLKKKRQAKPIKKKSKIYTVTNSNKSKQKHNKKKQIKRQQLSVRNKKIAKGKEKLESSEERYLRITLWYRVSTYFRLAHVRLFKL